MTDQPTDKRYLDDPYVRTFTANVLSSQSDPDGRIEVRLDQSYFYPESGGQLPDAGVIGGVPVLDVQERDDDVVHVVGTAVTGQVECALDWNRRFDHMQQHTGQHVLSRAFIAVGDLHTVSFHMGEETCTIDLSGAGFGEDVARRAERAANEIIEQNRPVNVRTVPLEELDAMNLRRKVPEGVREARLVEVSDFDVIPCCGTHVRSTGELGVIKVLKAEKVRETTRVHFVVGRRALDDYRQKHDIVQELAGRFTTGAGEISAKVDKLEVEGRAAKKRVKDLTARLAEMQASSVLEGAAQLANGWRLVRYLDEGADADYLRALSARVCAGDNVVALLGGGDGAVLCAASRGIKIDLATRARELAAEMGGSGGGKGAFAQVKLDSPSKTAAFLEQVEAHLHEAL